MLNVLDEFVDRTPGSFIEEKEFSVVWHYRMSDPEFGEWLVNELVATLDHMLTDTEFRAVHGSKSVEVRPIWANKAQVKQRLTNSSEWVLGEIYIWEGQPIQGVHSRHWSVPHRLSNGPKPGNDQSPVTPTLDCSVLKNARRSALIWSL